MSKSWLQNEAISKYLHHEAALVSLGLALVCWIFYRTMLQKVSHERHRVLRKALQNILGHGLITGVSYGSYLLANILAEEVSFFERLSPYLGALTLFWGAVFFLKGARLLVLEYLFLRHLTAPVPILIVNIFTIAVALIFGIIFISEIFGVRLMPLLATSAIFSAVIGLAVQDTLINLFAGIALQFDSPFEIGDWIEVTVSGQRFSGKVLEVSWRSVLLEGFSDERITISNRSIAQGQITNYSGSGTSILRNQIFRIPYGSDLPQVEASLLSAAHSVSGVLKTPSPLVLFNEAAESWVSAKVVYAVDNLGASFKIGDLIVRAGLDGLRKQGVTPASPRLSVEVENK